MAAYDDALISLRADLNQLRSDTRQIKTLMEQAFTSAPVDKFNASMGKVTGVFAGLRTVVKTVAASFTDVRLEMEKTALVGAKSGEVQARTTVAVVKANATRAESEQRVQKLMAETGLISSRTTGVEISNTLKKITLDERRVASIRNVQRAEEQASQQAIRDANAQYAAQMRLMGTRVRTAGRAVNTADNYYANQDRQLNRYAKTMNDAANSMANFSSAEDRALKSRYNQNRNLFNSTANDSDKGRMNQIISGGGNDQGLLKNAGQMTSQKQVQELNSAETTRLNILRSQGVEIDKQQTGLGKLLTRTGQHTLQWGGLLLTMEAINIVIETITGNMNEMVSKGSEFQRQGVLFQAYQRSAASQGLPQAGGDTSTQQHLQDSIGLATKYGEEVNTVSQDLELWTKRTGDHASALYLTNEALELSMVSGQDLEDTYRDLSGLATEWSGNVLQTGDKVKFNLADTDKLLQMVTSAALAMGAGFHMVGKSGQEMGESSQNAVGYLMKGLLQDAGALTELNYSSEKQIGITAALIQGFGNIGVSADEAGDRLSRLTGGIAALSNPAKVNDLLKVGFKLPDLKNIFNTNGDVIKNFAQLVTDSYKGVDGQTVILTKSQKAYLETMVAGPRQFNAMKVVLADYEAHLKEITSSTKDLGAEDAIAANMTLTYQQETAKLSAEWEGFLIILSQGVLPALTQFVSWLAVTGIPAIEQFSNTIGQTFQNIGSLGKMTADYGIASTLDPRVSLKDREAALEDMKKEYAALNARKSGQDRDALASTRTVRTLRYPNQPAGPNNPWDTHNELAYQKPSEYGYMDASHQYNAAIKANANISDLDRARMRARLGTGAGEAPGTFIGDPAASTKGQASAGEMLKIVQKEIDEEYKDQLENLKELVRLDDERIKTAERHVRIEGATSANVRAEQSAYGAKQKDEHTEADFIRKHVQSTLKPEAANDLSLAKQAGYGTKAWGEFMEQYFQVRTEIRSSAAEVSALSNDWKDLADKSKEAGAAGVAYNVGQITTGAKNSLDPLQARVTSDQDAIGSTQNIAQKYADIKDEAAGVASEVAIWDGAAARILATANTTSEQQGIAAGFLKAAADASATLAKNQAEVAKYSQDVAKSLREALVDVSSQVGEALAKGVGAASWLTTYREELAKIAKEAEQAREKIRTFVEDGANPAGVQMLASYYALQQKVNTELAKFVEQSEMIKSTDIYQATEAGLSTLLSGLESDVFKNMFDVTGQENAITATKDYINALEQQKQVINTTYDESKAHSAMDNANKALALYLLDVQIRKQKELEQAQQYKLEHPSLLVSVAQDFSKSMMTNILAQFKSGAMQNIFPGLKPDPQLSKDYAQYTTSTNLFGTKVDSFAAAVKQMPGAGGAPGAAGITPSTMDSSDANAAMADMMFGPDASNSNPMMDIMFGPDAGEGTDNVQTALSGSLTSQQPGGQTLLSSAMSTGMQSFAGVAGNAIGLLGLGVGGPGGSASLKTGGALASMAGGALSNFGAGQTALGNAPGGTSAETTTGSDASQAGAYAGAAGNIISSFGTSTDSGIGSVIGGGAGAFIGSFAGPMGTAIGAEIGSSIGGVIGGLFGPHYSNTTNPDMYANNGFAQNWANINGVAGTAANGTVQENPLVSQELNGQSEMQYLDQWVSQHPGGAGLSGASLSEWQQVYKLTQGGSATGISGLHNGNMGVEGAQGQTMTQNWQSLMTTIQDTTQAVLTFQNALNATPEALVSLNMFGSSGGYFPYAWNTPGYQYPAGGAGVGNFGTNPTAGGTNGYANPTAPGAAGSGTPGYNNVTTVPYGAPASQSNGNVYNQPGTNGMSGQAVQVNINQPITLDGRTIAMNTQSYLLRANGAGYQYVQ